jgi:hypothetical protein
MGWGSIYTGNFEDTAVDAPLLYGLMFAMSPGWPVDNFLKTIFKADGSLGGAGSDPGWSIDWIPEASEALFPEDWTRCMAQLPAGTLGCFEAWTYQPISDLEPPCAYYPEAVVRRHVRRVLDNFRAAHPERAAEVAAVIQRMRLDTV